MCLFLDMLETQKLLGKNKRTVTVFKILRLEKGKLCSLIHNKYVWKPGLNIMAGIRRKNIQTYKVKNWFATNSASTISKGIHSYRSLKITEYHYNPTQIIVKFIANLDDLIGANHEEMVFTKLYLTKQEYNKALKGLK